MLMVECWRHNSFSKRFWISLPKSTSTLFRNPHNLFLSLRLKHDVSIWKHPTRLTFSRSENLSCDPLTAELCLCWVLRTQFFFRKVLNPVTEINIHPIWQSTRHLVFVARIWCQKHLKTWVGLESCYPNHHWNPFTNWNSHGIVFGCVKFLSTTDFIRK